MRLRRYEGRSQRIEDRRQRLEGGREILLYGRLDESGLYNHILMNETDYSVLYLNRYASVFKS
jgi:hypothetical protein